MCNYLLCAIYFATHTLNNIKVIITHKNKKTINLDNQKLNNLNILHYILCMYRFFVFQRKTLRPLF